MCLDLFTVILGGVTAILPIFAKDILHVGPFGLGLLRSAPAAGALVVGLSLVRLPVQRRAGAILLWTVAGYGVCTVVFGVSTLFWLSLAMMAALGGFDMVSVVIRQTLVQVATPEHMRGRVNAVNAVFVGASNQIGGFESGALAGLIGAAGSAVVGGVGAIAVVVAIAWLFPELRHADRLHEPGLEEAALEPA
jgi:MFS family permease